MSSLLRWMLVGGTALAVLWWLGDTPVAPSVHEPEREPEREAPSAAIEIASVKLPPRPAPRSVRPAPPIPPAPPARERAEPVHPDSELLSRGAELLAEGAFPRLRATYIRIGFDAYRRALVGLGGAFYLYDGRERQPVVEVDGVTGDLGSEGWRSELSRWPRDVTRHLPGALERGRRRYGARVSHVVLLPPARLDAALLGAVDRRMRELGLDARSLLHIDVAYELRGDRLECDVLAVGLSDGTERDLGLLVDLSFGDRS